MPLLFCPANRIGTGSSFRSRMYRDDRHVCVALLSIALVPLFRKVTLGRVALLLLFTVFACKGVMGIRAQQRFREHDRSSFIISPEIKAAIMASPSKLLYTQDVDLFGFLSFHKPDADVRSHLALVYSADEEARWNHSVASTRTALHLKSFVPCTIVPYESLVTQPGEHTFIVTIGGWNWIDKALGAEHLNVTPIGHIFGAEVVSVRFAGAMDESKHPGTTRVRTQF